MNRIQEYRKLQEWEKELVNKMQLIINENTP